METRGVKESSSPPLPPHFALPTYLQILQLATWQCDMSFGGGKFLSGVKLGRWNECKYVIGLIVGVQFFCYSVVYVMSGGNKCNTECSSDQIASGVF